MHPSPRRSRGPARQSRPHPQPPRRPSPATCRPPTPAKSRHRHRRSHPRAATTRAGSDREMHPSPRRSRGPARQSRPHPSPRHPSTRTCPGQCGLLPARRSFRAPSLRRPGVPLRQCRWTQARSPTRRRHCHRAARHLPATPGGHGPDPGRVRCGERPPSCPRQSSRCPWPEIPTTGPPRRGGLSPPRWPSDWDLAPPTRIRPCSGASEASRSPSPPRTPSATASHPRGRRRAAGFHRPPPWLRSQSKCPARVRAGRARNLASRAGPACRSARSRSPSCRQLGLPSPPIRSGLLPKWRAAGPALLPCSPRARAPAGCATGCAAGTELHRADGRGR